MNEAVTSSTAAAHAASTQASGVYEQLREDLLSGHLKPLQKLRMRFLVDAYGTGQTPLREALNRLTSGGLVECRDQRGFYVKGISRSELAELTKTRCWVEGLALRESLAASTPEWEEALVLALHRLGKVPRSLSAERFEDNPEWERRHRTFHRTLIGHCGSSSLIAFCEQLADQLYRYQRLSIRVAFLSRQVADEHRRILDAILRGDGEGAAEHLTAHYEATAEVLLSDDTISPGLSKAP